MRAIPFTILMCSFCLALGQKKDINFGLAFSLDYNSQVLVEDNPILELQGKTNISTGMVLHYGLNTKTSLSIKALYSTKNLQASTDFSSYKTTDPNDPLLNTSGKLITDYSNKYIDIPIDVSRQLWADQRLSLLGTIGINNSILIEHDAKIRGSAFNVSNKIYKDYLLSAKLGIGLFAIWEKFGLFIEPQVRFYINDVYENLHYQNPVHFGLECQLLKL